MKQFKDLGRALTLWRELVKNQERHERLIADLVAHPDVTPEQLIEAATRLRAMRTNVREAYGVMRERVPLGSVVLLSVPAFMKRER